MDVDVYVYVCEMCMFVAGRRCRPEMWLCYVMLLPAGDAGHKCLWMKCLQVPREALEFAGTSINFRSGKFGYSICPFFSKGHAEFFREFWHDFAKNRTYGEDCLII